MVRINSNYDKLQAGYLFPEIRRRANSFTEKNPGISLMRLGIGNTTEPLTPTAVKGLQLGVKKLSDVKTYSGYGDEQGELYLRNAFVSWYKKRGVSLDVTEIFISDGAKADAGNIQSIFSENAVVALQDPVYPVYLDTNVIAGRSGKFNSKTGCYEGIVYMPCNERNGFTPDLPKRRVDLIYLCSPNNPTGAVLTKDKLKGFVDYAIKNKAVIIFDSAYSMYICEDSLPHSIYEIEGSKECAIEISSFSKWAGFTGVRLGWTVVPKDLVVEGSTAGKVNSLWNRRQCTFFNGASNIVQEGGLSVLSAPGEMESSKLIDYYMENARIIKEGVGSVGLTVYGGINAPYLWVKTPMKSWDFFDYLMKKAHVVCTPGAGFGPSGEGFVRFSSFGHREDIKKAVASIKKNIRF